MADSIREQILKAFITALNAPSNKPATASRSRVDALSSGELPAFVVRARDEDAARRGPTASLRSLRVRVESHVEGAAPADSLLDPLLVYVVQTVYADTGIAALIREIDETHIDWEAESGYAEVATAAQDFTVTFATQAADPTQKF
jgi:hypothetical protein